MFGLPLTESRLEHGTFNHTDPDAPRQGSVGLPRRRFTGHRSGLLPTPPNTDTLCTSCNFGIWLGMIRVVASQVFVGSHV